MKDYGQDVIAPKNGGYEVYGVTRRATMRCGQCGVPMGSELSDGHYCDDRITDGTYMD